MRTALSLAALIATTTFAGVAQAQQPVDPYDTADVAGPATEAAQPINPYGYAPPTEAPPPAYTAPQTGGYYQYPATTQYPVYAAPSCCCNPCQQQYPVYPSYALRRPTMVVKQAPKVWDGVRRFSLGVHGTAMWMNQNVGNSQVVLGGAGFQLRVRSKGRFGLEINQGFLGFDHNDYHRTSFPFQFSLMLYLFPNQDERHFNIYGLAGFGAMLDAVHVRDENNRMVEQDFLEWMGHVGLGTELRFKWFAIAADARLLGTLRDGSSTPARYYQGVQGGPIPDKNYGVSANAYINFWF
jgi:hypothetical protein